MRHPRALLATFGLLAIASTTALAHSAAIRSSDPGRACTEIGCQSGVFFSAGSYLATHASVARVQLCSLGRCRSTRRGQPTAVGRPLVLPVASARPITVTVTAFDRRGHVVPAGRQAPQRPAERAGLPAGLLPAQPAAVGLGRPDRELGVGDRQPSGRDVRGRSDRPGSNAGGSPRQSA